MTRLADLPLVEVAGRAEWRAWLERNHFTSPGVWLAVGKKGNERTALTYEDAVEEALCFGWIESVVNRLDADRFKQLLTPRKRGSAWARTNKERVERLAARGLMTGAGLAAVEAAKADGSWQALDDVEDLVVPDDPAAALAADSAAAKGFDSFTSSVRKMILYRISEAKRPHARARRIEQTVAAAAEGRPPWPAARGAGPAVESAAPVREIGEHLWRWERRHPEWHPGQFGATVASYAIRVGDATLLIDPLVDDEHDPVFDELDRIAEGPVRILISIPYHTRSAELFWHRYRTHDARILGHELVRKRLHDSSGFHPLVGGEDLDGMARIHRIGRPARAEMPIEIPSQRALIFGDAIIETGGQLRVWEAPLTGERRQHWYAERLLPTLRALAESDPERILVTHGRAVLWAGSRELEGALAREPWQPGGAG
jgi:uncharacterized protein YdeI (YjbR/CyaY-like superfamily)